MTAPVDSSLWLRRFNPGPADATTLVCFPHAGGSASFYLPVSTALSAHLDVVALQYPGRQDRRQERLRPSIGELADEVFAALTPLTGQPLAFFGHSMGATLAFEVAQRMQQQLGVSPVSLFASGRRAPSCHRDETVHLSDDAGLISEMQQLAATDARLLADPDILRMILPAIRSDYRAAETYRYQPAPRLGCPIVALIGDADPKVTRAEGEAWAEHTTGSFELHSFTGGHFFLAGHQAAINGLLLDRLTVPA